ncbi:hypothetical protein NMY22_g6978 [Coprinellus aureogranulatus]|nr:hypothetical protein NMY22_g6978 [Coprinellus aureogranulatus]
MFFRFVARLLRRVRGPETPTLPPARPPLSSWFHVDLQKIDTGSTEDSVGVAERSQKRFIEALSSPFPDILNHPLHDGGVLLSIPQGVDLDTAAWMLKRSPSFDYKQQGQLLFKDEFNMPHVHRKRTLANAFKNDEAIVRKSVLCRKEETIQRATHWLKSFVSGADPGVPSHICSSVDMDSVWEHILYCVDASLTGKTLEQPPSPASVKEVPSVGHTAFFALGVFDHDLPGSDDPSLTMYSLRLTGWADYDSERGELRSGIKGELKCVNYHEAQTLDQAASEKIA